jgi:hypothetical protein
MSPFEFLIRPMTSLEGIELKEHNCACGCGKVFKKKKYSRQQYASAFCLELKGANSNFRNLHDLNEIRKANGHEEISA